MKVFFIFGPDTIPRGNLSPTRMAFSETLVTQEGTNVPNPADTCRLCANDTHLCSFPSDQIRQTLSVKQRGKGDISMIAMR